MLTALLFAPSTATEAGADVLEGWEDISIARPTNAPPAEAPAQPQRPEVSITAGDMASLTRDEYRTYNELCKSHIDRIGHWDHSTARWYEGTGTAYYDCCASREDIARRMQRQHHEAAGNPRLRWEYAMQMAGDVHDILKSYHEELQHQKRLETCHTACNASSWIFPFIEIHRRVMDDEWWGKVHPHIVTRRMALVGDHAFRNALEVFLQLRSEGRDLADIKAKYPEVYTALNAVIDPTERQMNELRNYDRLTTNGQ